MRRGVAGYGPKLAGGMSAADSRHDSCWPMRLCTTSASLQTHHRVNSLSRGGV